MELNVDVRLTTLFKFFHKRNLFKWTIDELLEEGDTELSLAAK